MGFNPDLADTVNDTGKTPEGYADVEQDHGAINKRARARGVKRIAGGVVMELR